MQSEFSMAGKLARDRIAVPELSMDVIRRRSHAAAATWRIQALAACAALTIAALSVGIGFSANAYNGLRVWLSGGKVGMTVSSLEFVRQPMAAELRAIVRRATFPVTFPVGLPHDGGGMDFVITPPGHPSAIMISYKTDSIALLDPSIVDGEKLLPGTPTETVYHWIVNGELVLVTSRGISPAQADQMKAAMSDISPAESLAAVERLLPTVMVLGNTRANALTSAERLAPAGSLSVLIEPEHVRSLWQLAANGQALTDSRNLSVEKLATKNGRADLTSGVWTRTKKVAVPPNGVRAIVEALRASGVKQGALCDCALLYNPPSEGAYRVWTISKSPGGNVTAYSVDTTTLAVRRL
jgi:hypothetical protein